MKFSYRSALSPIVFLVVSIPLNSALADNTHINAKSVDWAKIPESYLGPEFPMVFRYKTLVGPFGSALKAPNIMFGEAELAPGAIYVGRKHPAPEIYYVISGTAEWSVADETFIATAGSAIYTKPNAIHRMKNIGDTPLKTVWIWWGGSGVLNQLSIPTEAPAKQPEKAKFED